MSDRSDRKLWVELGRASAGERPTLMLVQVVDDPGRTDVDYELHFDGRSMGGGSAHDLSDVRRSMNMVQSPGGVWWMWGAVDVDCAGVTCNGRQAEILRSDLVNRSVFILPVDWADEFTMVFTSSDGTVASTVYRG